MNVREGTLVKQEKILNKVISMMTKKIKERKQKDKTWEENMHRLDVAKTLACNNFIDEGITNAIFMEEKVFWLRNIAENICKKVTDLESQVTPTTHPEVLEERRNATTDVAKRIEEAEALCAKAVEQVS